MLGINGASYGQNGGYTGNCTTDFSGQEELDVYWYHPDHLGSSSFITGIDGEVNQNIEYFPSGETFVENHLNSYNIPYKFNSKELDDETGYYYYGARYYNPRTSIWLNVDPLFEASPSFSPYAYALLNPIKFIDPTGMIADYPIYGRNGQYLGDDGRSGGGDLAFIGESDGKGGFKNLQQFTTNHTEFKNNAAMVSHEASFFGDADTNLWIAHTVNNALGNSKFSRGKKTFNALMKTGYSSLKNKSKEISISDNSATAKYARAAMIDVSLGGADPTGGAVLWDGMDLISTYGGKNDPLQHPKFGQYASVGMSRQIVDSMVSFWSDPNHSRLNPSSSILTDAFSVKKGMQFGSNGVILSTTSVWAGSRYPQGRPSSSKSSLVATGFQSGTVFWRPSR